MCHLALKVKKQLKNKAKTICSQFILFYFMYHPFVFFDLLRASGAQEMKGNDMKVKKSGICDFLIRPRGHIEMV